MLEPQRPYVGVHLLIFDEGKLLLMKRTVKDQMEGMYALVAGKVDQHESPKIALVREVFEETNLRINPEHLVLIATVHHAKTDYKAQKEDVIEFYFKTDQWQGKPVIMEPDKASELGFYRLDELPTPMPKGLQFALHALKGGPSFIEIR